MRVVIQRVLQSRVEVNGVTVGAIDRGLLVYVGVAVGDGPADAAMLAEKIRFLRIFEDEQGKMNLDVVQAQGAVLAVSAFTVQADARKGRRPSFDAAARGDEARELYERFCESLEGERLTVARGEFGAYMQVHSVNDGPVCILLDSLQRTPNS